MELLLGDILKNQIDEFRDPRYSSQNFIFQDCLRIHELSPLTDLIFADTSNFPQGAKDFILSQREHLEQLYIFTEYYPFLGLSQNIHYYSEDPQICTLLRLCYNQLSPQTEEQTEELEIEI